MAVLLVVPTVDPMDYYSVAGKVDKMVARWVVEMVLREAFLMAGLSVDSLESRAVVVKVGLTAVCSVFWKDDLWVVWRVPLMVGLKVEISAPA